MDADCELPPGSLFDVAAMEFGLSRMCTTLRLISNALPPQRTTLPPHYHHIAPHEQALRVQGAETDDKRRKRVAPSE
eukprot:1852622-Alexandrium_andersonii.AAC.1